MELLSIKRSSLVIYPDKLGNLAKFIAGINNKDPEGRKMQNVSSIKYNIQGSPHILLYANKHIVPGTPLYYNYNSGSRNEFDTRGYRKLN